MSNLIRRWVSSWLGLDEIERRQERQTDGIHNLARRCDDLLDRQTKLNVKLDHVVRTAEASWALLEQLRSTRTASGKTLGEIMDESASLSIEEQRLRHRASAAAARGMTLEQYEAWVGGRAERKAIEAAKWDRLHGKASGN